MIVCQEPQVFTQTAANIKLLPIHVWSPKCTCKNNNMPKNRRNIIENNILYLVRVRGGGDTCKV